MSSFFYFFWGGTLAAGDTPFRDWRPCTTACPVPRVAGRWGNINWNSVVGRLEQLRQNKNLLYRHGRPYESTKEGPLSFVLFESSFASVSTVSRGHLSLVSMPAAITYFYVQIKMVHSHFISFQDYFLCISAIFYFPLWFSTFFSLFFKDEKFFGEGMAWY